MQSKHGRWKRKQQNMSPVSLFSVPWKMKKFTFSIFHEAWQWVCKALFRSFLTSSCIQLCRRQKLKNESLMSHSIFVPKIGLFWLAFMIVKSAYSSVDSTTPLSQSYALKFLGNFKDRLQKVIDSKLRHMKTSTARLPNWATRFWVPICNGAFCYHQDVVRKCFNFASIIYCYDRHLTFQKTAFCIKIFMPYVVSTSATRFKYYSIRIRVMTQRSRFLFRRLTSS